MSTNKPATAKNSIVFTEAESAKKQARIDALEVGQALFDCEVISRPAALKPELIASARTDIRAAWCSQLHRAKNKTFGNYETQSWINIADNGAVAITLMVLRTS